MDTQDAINTILDCQERMQEALGELESVARNLNDIHAEAYIIAHLKTLLSSNHGYLCSDYNLDKWVRDLENSELEKETVLEK